MQTIRRSVAIQLPKGQSAFLWGPRKTGKTTFLRTAFPDSIVYDLLQTGLFLELSKRPSLLREQLLATDPGQLEKPIACIHRSTSTVRCSMPPMPLPTMNTYPFDFAPCRLEGGGTLLEVSAAIA